MKHPGRLLISVCSCALLACALLAVPTRAQVDNVTAAVLQKTAQANFPEFLEALALPNDAINAEDIRKNAEWLEIAFRKRGFTTRQLPNDGKPLVFAEFGRHVPNAKTVLFYIHFD